MRPPVARRNNLFRQIVDLTMRFAPVLALMAIGAYIAANQAVSPQRRVIKVAVLLGLLSLILRFDMVYSVFLFTILYPFPSGVSLGSTNSVLMTLIPLIWIVRAQSTGARLFRRTRVDAAIALLLIAYVLSLFNVESEHALTQSLKIIWRQVACVAYFFMIVTFVDDEKKLERMLKVVSTAAGFVMLTAIVELFAPGHTLIPGWISLVQKSGQGSLTFRIQGIRLGGAFESHGMLSDYATITIFFMVFLFLRSRNPLAKTIWGGIALMTFIAFLATANRGAFFGSVIGFLYLMFLLRKRISLTRIVIVAASLTAFLLVSEYLLDRYTYATSLTNRVAATTFQGVVPDTRVVTWKPALLHSLDHVFIGHGPFFDITGRWGTSRIFWPHNAYIFYLYTLGVFGLGAFLFVVVRVFQLSQIHRLPAIEGTFPEITLKILQTQLVVCLVEQLRTDHQRDNIYPFIIWMLFGMIAATANIVHSKLNALRNAETVEGGETA